MQQFPTNKITVLHFAILLVCFNPYFWAKACFQVLGSWHKWLLQWPSATHRSAPVHGAATWWTVKSLALQHSAARSKAESHSLLCTCSSISNLRWVYRTEEASLKWTDASDRFVALPGNILFFPHYMRVLQVVSVSDLLQHFQSGDQISVESWAHPYCVLTVFL